MLHARVLDYTIDKHLQDYAVVILVQPDGDNTFLNAVVWPCIMYTEIELVWEDK